MKINIVKVKMFNYKIQNNCCNFKNIVGIKVSLVVLRAFSALESICVSFLNTFLTMIYKTVQLPSF